MKNTDDSNRPKIETEPNPFAEENNKIGGGTQINAMQFTHLNPEGGIEFAQLRIEYVPRQEVLNGDSVTKYLDSFRNLEMSQEAAIKTVTSELSQACMPLTLQVTSSYAARNGVALNPQGRFVHPEAQQQGAQRIMTPGMMQ